MSEELCRLLRANAKEEWMTIGAKPFAVEAATLIEQQAARIAELEGRPYHYIGRDGKTITAAALEDRAKAAEAEVKRLREALVEVRDKALEEAAKWIRAQIYGDDSDAYTAGYNDALHNAAALLFAAPLREELAPAVATQSPNTRRDDMTDQQQTEKPSGPEVISVDEIHARFKAQGVSAREHIAFKCPVCATVQSMASLIKAGCPADKAESYIGFSCIGRFNGAGEWPRDPVEQKRRTVPGCNWTLGGLFQIHKLAVATPDGRQQPTFEVASPEQAKALEVSHV